MKKIALVFFFAIASITVSNAATTDDNLKASTVAVSTTLTSGEEKPKNTNKVDSPNDDGSNPCCQSASATGNDVYGNSITVTSTHCSGGGCISAHIMAQNKADARLHQIQNMQ